MAKRTPSPATKKKAPAKRAKVIAAPSEADAPAPINYPAPMPMGEILGQNRAIGLLDSAMTSGRLHHAWIFHGPRGVGKFTAALALAAILLDPTSAPDEQGHLRPDPESRVQDLLRARLHPDLHVIVKELARFHSDAQVRSRTLATIPVDVIRDHLLAPAVLAPHRRDHGLASKVFIIDEAELLDRSHAQASSQNAMLKVMEEPPPGTVIILVTTSEDKLLPTIRSRCQRVAFTGLAEPAMDEWLARQSTPDARHPGVVEGLANLSESDRAWAISASAGSPGRLVELIETGLMALYNEIKPLLNMLDKGGFPPELAGRMDSLTNEWAESWIKRNTNASSEAAKRLAMHELFALLAERYRPRPTHSAGQAAWAASCIESIASAQRDLATNVNKTFVIHRLVANLVDARSGEPVMG